MKKRLANIITTGRLLLSFSLLFIPALSLPFDIIYLLCGVGDMVDGPVARRTGSVSQSGARLDSAADFIFVVICLVKLLPALRPGLWIWICAAVTALVRLTNLILGLVCRGRLIMLHTAANRLAGLLLFLLPPAAQLIGLDLAAIPVCAAAIFASVQEGHFIRTGRIMEN